MTVNYHYLKIGLSTTLLQKIDKSAKKNNREREKEIQAILRESFNIKRELAKYKIKCAMLEDGYKELKNQCSVLEGKKNIKSADGRELRLINIGLLESVAAEIEKIAISRNISLGTEISFACQSYISENKASGERISQMVQQMHEEEEKRELLAVVGGLVMKVESLEKEVQGLKE